MFNVNITNIVTNVLYLGLKIVKLNKISFVFI